MRVRCAVHTRTVRVQLALKLCGARVSVLSEKLTFGQFLEIKSSLFELEKV